MQHVAKAVLVLHRSSPVLSWFFQLCQGALGRRSDKERAKSICAVVAERLMGERLRWCWLDTGGSHWYVDGAAELPFPAQTSVVRSDLEIFPAAR